MNIGEFASIMRVVLMLCAAGVFLSGLVKAKRARKNGRSGIGSIAVGVISAIVILAMAVYLGNTTDSGGEYIKLQHPTGVLNITYGQALDKVCGNQKWYQMTSEASNSGQAIVQMDADCNYNGAVRKITIQFNYGVRDFVEIDANTPFQITFVGFDDAEETSVSAMQDLIYEMFAHYAADNGIELDTSVKDTILYSSGWDADKITSNKMEPVETKPAKTETTEQRLPRDNAMQGEEEYDPLFEQFSEFMYQYADFSGMSEEEIQSFLEEAYAEWLYGEGYDEIVFDENLELTIQDIDDVSPTVTTPEYGEVNEEMPEGSYTDYQEWGGYYDDGWETELSFSLYSDGTQNPECGSITTFFGGMENTGKLYYLGDNAFRWESEGYDSAGLETYYVYAVYEGGEYQLMLYNSDADYEGIFTLYEQYIP